MSNICKQCEDPSWTGQDPIVAPDLPGGGEGGTNDFNLLDNRPKYGGTKMTGDTNIPNVSNDISQLNTEVGNIEDVIPETASSNNQLADKNFVNSSVATNTANFIGTYNTIEELEAVQDPSNNDYGFVISTDAAGNTVYNRYKYNASTSTWAFEYALNNSSFTADQWAAINSAITSSDVTKIRGIAEIVSISTGLDLDANGALTAKLYTETGNNTDGSMTQKAITDALAGAGGGDAVYSTKTTSNSRDGGAIYIGDKNTTQGVVDDPTTTDNHYRYFWAMPFSSSMDATTVIPGDETLNIGGVQGTIPNGMNGGIHNVTLGYRTKTASWEDGQTVTGWQAQTGNGYSTAYGANANASAKWSTAIGYDAQCYQQGSVAIGKGAYPTRPGEVCVGSDSHASGFNNTNYRVIGGVHDGQDAHDAATVGQITPLSGSAAPTTATVGVLGKIYIDTSTATAYMCVEVDDVTPSYTWKQITA